MKLGVSYFGNRIPRHYRDRDLPEIVAAGCSYVVHTFSEEDLRFYRGAVGEIVALTRNAGLEAHLDPWGVGGVFGGEAFSNFLLHHRDDWQVRADGTPVPMACLRSQRFQAFVRSWVDAAVELGADAPVLGRAAPCHPRAKSPRQAGSLTCWCDACRAAYRAEYGEPMPERAHAQRRCVPGRQRRAVPGNRLRVRRSEGRPKHRLPPPFRRPGPRLD